MSFFSAIAQGAGDVLSLPSLALHALAGGGLGRTSQGAAAAPMGAIGMSGDDDPYSITPSQSPPAGVLGQLPTPPPQNPILGGIDNLLFHGAFGTAQQMAYARQLASYNAGNMVRFGQSLPEDQRSLFFADPAGWFKVHDANATLQSIKGGDSLGNVNGVAVTAPIHVLDDKSGTDEWSAPSGSTITGSFGGDYSAKDGIISSGRTGGVSGAYGLPQVVPPANTPKTFVPNLVPAIPQVGARPPAPAPVAAPAAVIAQTPAPAPTATAIPQVGQVADVPPPPQPPNPNGPAVQPAFTFQSPVAAGTPITSGYGARTRPMKGATANHLAVDFGGAAGAPVTAAGPGTVTYTGRRNGYGNTVVIRHPDGSTSQYSHLSTIAAKAGQPINAGDPVGAIGQTGTATGPNLHFAMFDKSGNAVDPRKVLGTSASGAGAPGAQASASSAGGTWSTGDQPAGGGAQRYRIVDGSQVPGGKPGERYNIDTLGQEPPKPVSDGTYNPGMIAQRGTQFMDSEDYKNSANTISAVNGLIRTMKTVGPSAPLSWASLDTAMRAFNPSMGVRQNAIQAFMEEVGLPAEVQSEVMKFQGKGFVPPEIQHQLMTAAYAYAESHTGILQQRHQANVDWAKSHGFSEADLGENLPQVEPFPLDGPPRPQDLVAGRVYSTPKGALKWTAKGFVPAGQP